MKRSVTLFFRIALFAVILINFSCNKEEIGSGRNSEFILKVDKGSNDSIFIFCTNQTGELLFDTIATKIVKVIKFKVSSSDKIDLNIADKFEQNVSVITYKDIKSGFNLEEGYLCDNPFDHNFAAAHTYELQLKGISKYQKLYFPDSYNRTIEKNEADNSILIKGFGFTASDAVITILPENSNQHLSYYITDSDKVISDNHCIVNINFNDFEPSVEHDILLNVSSRWYLSARAISEEGKKVEIFELENYSGANEITNMLKIYTTDFKVSQFRLSANLGYTPIDYAFQKYYTEIPKIINLFDPKINISLINPGVYSLSTDQEYQLATITYSGASKLYWKVHEKYANNLMTKNPVLPTKIANDLNFTGNYNFNRFNAKFSKLGANFNNEYTKSSKAVEIFCGEKESKSITQDY